MTKVEIPTEKERRLSRAKDVHSAISNLYDELDHIDMMRMRLWTCNLSDKDETIIKAKLIELEQILTNRYEELLLTGR